MLVGLLCVLERELLHHAHDAVQLRESNSLLAVECVAGWEATDRRSLHDQIDRVDLDAATRREDEDFATRLQTAGERADGLGVRRGADDQAGAAHLHELLGRVVLRAVDVLVRAELRGEVPLAVAGRKGHDLVAHLVRVLHRQVSQAAQALHGHDVAGWDLQLADGIEDRDASTQNGRVLSRVDLFRHPDDGLGPQQHVLGKPAVLGNAVDGAVLAHLELPSVTLLAGAVVSAVPRAPDAVSDLPALLAVADCDDVADDFVPWDDREGVSKGTGLHTVLGAADTTGEDFDENLANRRGLEVTFFDGEGRVDLLEDGGFVGLGEGGHVGDGGLSCVSDD